MLAVFATVCLGMFLGGLPGLKLDRSGVALLGAIALIALGGQTLAAAAQAVDLPALVGAGVPVTLGSLGLLWGWMRWTGG